MEMNIGKYTCTKCGLEEPVQLRWTDDLNHGDLTTNIAFIIHGHTKKCYGYN